MGSRKLVFLLFFDAAACFTALGLALWLFPDLWLLIILATFFATLPDFLWILHYGFKKQHWFFRFHKKIQWAEKPWGAWVELPFTILLITFVIVLSKVT